MNRKNNLILKLCAVILCICLISATTFAGASCVDFDLNAAIDREQLSPDDGTFTRSIADLLDKFSLSGQMNTNEKSFDSAINLNAKGSHKTLAEFHAYGTNARIMLESSLFGNEKLLFQTSSWLDFANKIYSHLGFPLQRLAILTSGYPTSKLWNPIIKEFRETMASSVVEVSENKWKISNKSAYALAKSITDSLKSDYAFETWVKSIAMETGYDEYLMDIILGVPAWFRNFADGRDIIIEKNGSTEKWTCGSNVLGVKDGSVWSISLPAFSDRSTLIASGDLAGFADGTFNCSCSLRSSKGENLLTAYVKCLNMPKTLSENVAFTFVCNADGAILPKTVNVFSQMTVSDGNLLLNVAKDSSSKPWLTVDGKLTPTPTDYTPYFTGDALDVSGAQPIFGLADASLVHLVKTIAPSMIKGSLPVLARIPPTVYQEFMNFMDESGVMAELSESALADDELAEDDEE